MRYCRELYDSTGLRIAGTPYTDRSAFRPSELIEASLPVIIMKYIVVTGGVVSGLGKGITIRCTLYRNLKLLFVQMCTKI
jgi:hypothetical protein